MTPLLPATRRALGACVFAAVLTASPPGQADGGVPTRELPLNPLPKPPKRQLRPATEEATAWTRDLLSGLASGDPGVRESAAAEILEVQPSAVPAIRAQLRRIADSADKVAMKTLLKKIRNSARDDVRREMMAQGKRGSVVTPDYLQMLLSSELRDKESFPDLISVVGLSRLLRQIDSVDSARALIVIRARFGEFLRADTQLQLGKMGDHAIAALIETKLHPAKSIAKWASKQLRVLKKTNPGDAIQTDDPRALGHILRAYGRTHDPDATAIIISYANSEQAQIRRSAREAVALFGETANWRLRDAYQNTVGKKPRRDWSWDRTARELFREFDRIRLSAAYSNFERGLAARRNGELQEMVKWYDALLVRSPLFEHGEELAIGYLEYAKTVQQQNPEAAWRALQRAKRLSRGAPNENHVRSLVLTAEGQRLLKAGTFDPVLFRRAVELDSDNVEAIEALGRATDGSPLVESSSRLVGASAIVLAVVIALVLIGLRRRDSTETVSS
ncbi:MAG: hypothetical protein HRU17_18550 [Polyangiaceae bacterium]|nr:hypothetical protein [Polyangiaceae bacterium]